MCRFNSRDLYKYNTYSNTHEQSDTRIHAQKNMDSITAHTLGTTTGIMTDRTTIAVTWAYVIGALFIFIIFFLSCVDICRHRPSMFKQSEA